MHLSSMTIGGGAGAGVFWLTYQLLGEGYGAHTMWRSALGAEGRDTSTNWKLQEIARAYFLRCVAFPRWVSLCILLTVLAALICFSGMLVTNRPSGPFAYGDLAAAFVLAALATIAFRERSQKVLEDLLPGKERQWALEELAGLPVAEPLCLLDFASFWPAVLWLGFLGSAAFGGLLFELASAHPLNDFATQLPFWLFKVGNLFALPLFTGFALIGLFPWPAGTVADDNYYPLLVLKRALRSQ